MRRIIVHFINSKENLSFIEVLEEYKNLTKKPKEEDPMKIVRVLDREDLTCYKGINL